MSMFDGGSFMSDQGPGVGAYAPGNNLNQWGAAAQNIPGPSAGNPMASLDPNAIGQSISQQGVNGPQFDLQTALLGLQGQQQGFQNNQAMYNMTNLMPFLSGLNSKNIATQVGPMNSLVAALAPMLSGMGSFFQNGMGGMGGGSFPSGMQSNAGAGFSFGGASGGASGGTPQTAAGQMASYSPSYATASSPFHWG